MDHTANCGWSKFITTIFLHPSFLQIVLSTACENDYSLPVLMAWENRKVNGAIARRMDKEYLSTAGSVRTRCKGTLHPGCCRSEFQILMIWIILQLQWSVIPWREQIIKLGFWKSYFYSFLSGMTEEGYAQLASCPSVSVSLPVKWWDVTYHIWFFFCFSVINKEPSHLNAPLLVAWF